MSSHKAGEPELLWRKASYCLNAECVEVAASGGVIFLRDSKAPDAGVLSYSVEDWRAFTRGVKSGEFDDLCGA